MRQQSYRHVWHYPLFEVWHFDNWYHSCLRCSKSIQDTKLLFKRWSTRHRPLRSHKMVSDKNVILWPKHNLLTRKKLLNISIKFLITCEVLWTILWHKRHKLTMQWRKLHNKYGILYCATITTIISPFFAMHKLSCFKDQTLLD